MSSQYDAAKLAELAFNEFIKSGAGEIAKKTVGGAIDLVKNLRDKIKAKFQGNERAEKALAEVEQQGSPAALDKITKYLDLELDEDEAFAAEVRQIAQQIINIQNQSISSRVYNNQGRDQINIEQVQGNVIIQNQSIRPRNELILLQAIEQEVESRLAQSLHNHVFVTLDKESHPEQVKRLWDTEIKIGTKPATPIAPETSILEVFEQPEIAGHLLILGDPGAGKTTTMLDLAKALVAKAEQASRQPIPVLFNLSSWTDPHQSIPDWLVEEFKSKYGARKDIARKWLQNQLILPMLDGLDEVKSEYQESCIAAINHWLQGDLRPPSVVVCSRKEEYANYQTQLNLNGAILLQLLTDEQIQSYLSEVSRTELWQLLQQDTELLELVRTPLLLSITILSYAELSLQQWQEMISTKERIKLLLDAYIRAMFSRQFQSRAYRSLKQPSINQTQQWLTFLALQMQHSSQTEFLIEKIQLSMYLSDKQLGLYGLIFGLIFGLICSLLDMRFSLRSIYNLIIGFFVGIGVWGSVNTEIKLVETINWSFKVTRKSARDILISMLVGAIVFGLFFSLSNLINGLIGGLIGGLIIGLIVWLIIGLRDGISVSEVKIKRFPNQGIWKSMSYAFFMAVISCLIFGLIGGLFIGKFLGILPGLIFGLTGGLVVGFGFGLNFGGAACIQHFTTRLILFFNKYIPWNYARFLNYCTDLLFLQRVGGHYRFIHRLLQEHFAEMEI